MDTDTDQQSRPRRPLWKRLLLLFVFCGLAGTMALMVVVVAGAMIVTQAISRWEINVDGQAIVDAIHESVRVTLRAGTDEQRLYLIGQLEQDVAQAKLFVPELLEAARDSDPVIRDAARRALRQIDPESLDAFEPM